MSNTSLGDLLGIVIGIVLGLILLYSGWERYTTGTMPESGQEFWRALGYVNFMNRLLLRPTQERLTTLQIRVAGILYMLGGTAILATLGLVVLGVLH
jgi:hypothetical protein